MSEVQYSSTSWHDNYTKHKTAVDEVWPSQIIYHGMWSVVLSVVGSKCFEEVGALRALRF